MKRQENLLQKCKEVMRTHKERSAQLGTENETLQEQLQERLQELEKIKVAHLWLMAIMLFILDPVCLHTRRRFRETIEIFQTVV